MQKFFKLSVLTLSVLAILILTGVGIKATNHPSIPVSAPPPPTTQESPAAEATRPWFSLHFGTRLGGEMEVLLEQCRLRQGIIWVGQIAVDSPEAKSNLYLASENCLTQPSTALANLVPEEKVYLLVARSLSGNKVRVIFDHGYVIGQYPELVLDGEQHFVVQVVN